MAGQWRSTRDTNEQQKARFSSDGSYLISAATVQTALKGCTVAQSIQKQFYPVKLVTGMPAVCLIRPHTVMLPVP